MSKNEYRDTDFLYATGRVRALETKLLTKNDILKMIDARDIDEAFRIPEEVDIGYGFSAAEYEKALNAELHECYDLVDSLVGDDNDFMKVFRYKYDGHNLKALIKEKALGKKTPDEVFSNLGNSTLEDLRSGLVNGKFERVNAIVAEAALHAEQTLAETGDAQRVDIIIDKAVLEAMVWKAENNGYKILTDMVRCMIDIANIRMVVRAERMGKELGFVKNILSDVGYIRATTWEKAYSAGVDALIEAIRRTDYGVHLESELAQVLTGGSLTQFEKLCDDFNKKKLDGTRRVAFGIEPVVAYVFAKEAEVRAIRIIMASKQAGVAPEEIYKRVREVYPG